MKIHEPPERWEPVSVPPTPAPLEKLGRPLWAHDYMASLWSFPTEADFVAYPEQPHRYVWMVQALEKFRIRLLSPVDLPFTFSEKPIAVR